jgi:large subunit ribosomal protein L35
MKTKKSLKSKFKVTGTGQLSRRQSGKRHIMTKKTPKRKRQLGKSKLVAKTHLKTYKQLMGV